MQQRTVRNNKLESASALRQYCLQVLFLQKPSVIKHFKVAVKNPDALNDRLDHYVVNCLVLTIIWNSDPFLCDSQDRSGWSKEGKEFPLVHSPTPSSCLKLLD